MAEGNSPVANPTPKWNHALNFDGDILGPLGITDLLVDTSALLEKVIAIGTFLQTGLEWVASFIVDLSNPIRPLIQGLIAYVTALLADLRKMGLYITMSDALFNASKNNRAVSRAELYDLTVGGYPTAIQELTNKFLDTNDPSRPNFSPASVSYNIVFFAGGGLSGLNAIMALISQFGSLFGAANFASLLNPPVIQSVTPDVLWGSPNTAEEVTVEYSLVAQNTYFNLPPAAFSLVVSTRDKKYLLYFKDELGRVVPLVTKEGMHLDTGHIPFLEARGDDLLPVVFAITEKNEQIPASNFLDENSVFLIEPFILTRIFGTLNFDEDIKYSDFPTQKYDVNQKTLVPETTNYYLSMASLPNGVDDILVKKPSVSDFSKLSPDFKVESISGAAIPSFGLSFPHMRYGDVQSRYMKAVKESLYRYILAKMAKLEGVPVNPSIDGEYDPKDIENEKELFDFRSEIKYVVGGLMDTFARRGVVSSAYISSNLTADIDRVLNDEVSFIALFEGSLRKNTKIGVFPVGGGGDNPKYFPVPASIQEVFFIHPTTKVGVNIKEFFGLGSEPNTLYSAYRLLSVLPKRPDRVGVGRWVFLRPLSDGFPALETVLETIREVLELLDQGMQGVVDAILSFIAVLEERIGKLQSILRLIQEVLDVLTRFRIPAGISTLGFSANGVSDIVNKLQQAEDSPKVVGDATFGFYMALSIGGVPSLLVELLRSLGGEE